MALILLLLCMAPAGFGSGVNRTIAGIDTDTSAVYHEATSKGYARVILTSILFCVLQSSIVFYFLFHNYKIYTDTNSTFASPTFASIHVHHARNTSAVVYIGSFSNLADCEKAVLAEPKATAFSFFDPAFNHRDHKWASGCYARIDGTFPKKKKVKVTSGAVTSSPAPPPPPSPPPSPPPPPAPPAPPTGKCKGSCSLNGICLANSTCQCDPAWTGSECQAFNILPAVKESGVRFINVPAGGPNVCSIRF